MSPDVSVVIPTRDRAPYVRQAVATALGQEGVAVEVLVVDDGSRDATPAVLAAIADERLHVHREPEGRGVAAARNRALAEARAPWIAFLDDDDLWAPGWLRAALDAGAAAQAGVVYGGCVLVDAGRAPVGAASAWEAATVADALGRENVIGGPSQAVLRTAAVRAAGGFDPAFSALADWDLWLRLRGEGFAAVQAAEPLVAYTVHPGNMHLRAPQAVLAEFRRFAAHHAAAAPELDERVFVDWLVDEHLAAGRRAGTLRLQARRLRLRGSSPWRHGTAHVLRRALRPRPRTATGAGVPAPAWLAPYRAPSP